MSSAASSSPLSPPPPVSPPADYAPSQNTSSLALTRANQLRIQSLLRRLLVTSNDRGDGDNGHIDTLRVLRKTLRELEYNLSWLTQVDLLETLEHILVSYDETSCDISADHLRDEQQSQRQQWRHKQRQRRAEKGNDDDDDDDDNADDDDGDDDEQFAGPAHQTPSASLSSSSWRLVHDATQLLLEALPLLRHEVGPELIDSIVPIVVENLGHQRSEVRRASLLLLNMLMRQMSAHFQSILRLFIDYGPANYRNPQARRGAILSLPLLMSQSLVERENLLPLVRCLSGLLVDDSNHSNEQLFYSLYLALQRLHMMMGDTKFVSLMGQCEPEAMQLYRQAASRHNSLAGSANGGSGSGSFERPGAQVATGARSPSPSSSSSSPEQQQQQQHRQRVSSITAKQSQASPPVDGGSQQQEGAARSQQHVTFENDSKVSSTREQQEGQEGANEDADQSLAAAGPTNSMQNGNFRRSQSDDSLSPSDSSSPSTIRRQSVRDGTGVGGSDGQTVSRREFSSDVSSTCSSDAHLVNPAHYMTKAALQGDPLDNYEQIHHIDHSQVDSLAINDFGPICNTPTMELAPKLNYLTKIRFTNAGVLSPTSGVGASLGQQQRQQMQSGSSSGALILRDDSLTRSELKFGILPRQLINISLNAALRSADRYEAMQELMCIVRESPVNHLAILMTYFDSFLEQFISKLIVSSSSNSSASAASAVGAPLNAANAARCQQANSGATMVQQQTSLKLSLIAIDMLETIVIKTKVSTMQYIRPIVGLLLKALGSQQASSASHTQSSSSSSSSLSSPTPSATAPLSPAASLMRENVCRVIHKMMAYLPPQHVIDAIFEHKHSRSPLVREESINRVTAACLEYDRNEFNLTKLCYHVLPMLADHEQNVRMAALECIATLAHILGPGRIGSLLTAAEAVQTNCDYDGLLGAINARLQRHALPRCHSNGMIKYFIKPLLFGASQLLATAASSTAQSDEQQQGQAPVAADIRWVLEAPSSHQHSGPYYHPHSHSHSHAHTQQPISALDIATGHVNNYAPGTGLDRAGTQHQHHRLGVYSPPSTAERRRRSSVGLIGHHQLADLEAKQQAAGFGSTQHLHEHHHALHHSAPSEERQRVRLGEEDNAGAVAGQQQQVEAQRKSRRESSRGENAAVGSRRQSSGPRPARQSIIAAQSQSDEVKAGTEIATNETGESRATDGRERFVGESNNVSGSCQRRASCSRKPSVKSSVCGNYSGSGSDCCCSAHSGTAARGDRVKSYSLPQQQSQPGSKTNLMRQQRLSCDHCSAGDRVQTTGAGDKAKGHSGSCSSEGGRQDRQQSRQRQSSRSRSKKSSSNTDTGNMVQKISRSNSQDSVSSTDTNKLLFQYYLGKFRQSLTESPIGNGSSRHQQAVLPSDSIIIYSDINQAHAQSRHQSRYQQTSFELSGSNNNAPDHNYQSSAGGRIVPTTPSSPIPAISKSSQQASSLEDDPDKAGCSGREMQSQAEQQQQRRQSQQRLTRLSSNTLRRQMSVASDERLAGDGDDLVRDQPHGSPKSAGRTRAQQQKRMDDANDVRAVDRRMSATSGTSNRRKQSAGDKIQQQQQQQQRRESQAAEVESERKGRSFSSGGQSQGQGRPGSELSDQTERRKSVHRAKSQSRDNSGELTDERMPDNNHNDDDRSDRNNQPGPLQRDESETTAPSISTIEYNPAEVAATGNTLCDQEQRFECRESSGASNSRRRSSQMDLDGQEQQSDDEQQVSSGGQNRKHRSEVRNSTKMTTRTRTGDEETVASVRRRASRSQPPSAGSHGHQARDGGDDSRPQMDRSAGSHDSESVGSRGGQHQETAHKRADQQSHHRQQHHNQHVQRQLKPSAGSGGGAGVASVRRSVSVSPSLSNSVNIRHILENVAQIEGNFVDPQLAYKVAMDALDSPCWSTKVEGILALIRLVAHHPQFILGQSAHNGSGRLHEMVLKLTNEIGNLRSTVARSAIFALGDFCAKLRRSIEPEMDLICKALLQKSNENTAFIRDDIKRALDEMVNYLTPWRLANSLIVHGAQHKSANVRRMASQFVAQLVVDRLGAAKCLVGSREISSTLLPAASKFAQDNSPHTRYYGRLILSKLMSHSSFDRLLRRNLTSTLYRSTVGIIESIKRRGPGELPQAD